jgi:hypothetical protein
MCGRVAEFYAIAWELVIAVCLVLTAEDTSFRLTAVSGNCVAVLALFVCILVNVAIPTKALIAGFVHANKATHVRARGAIRFSQTLKRGTGFRGTVIHAGFRSIGYAGFHCTIGRVDFHSTVQ